jgi:hypothetical protein
MWTDQVREDMQRQQGNSAQIQDWHLWEETEQRILSKGWPNLMETSTDDDKTTKMYHGFVSKWTQWFRHLPIFLGLFWVLTEPSSPTNSEKIWGNGDETLQGEWAEVTWDAVAYEQHDKKRLSISCTLVHVYAGFLSHCICALGKQIHEQECYFTTCILLLMFIYCRYIFTADKSKSPVQTLHCTETCITLSHT